MRPHHLQLRQRQRRVKQSDWETTQPAASVVADVTTSYLMLVRLSVYPVTRMCSPISTPPSPTISGGEGVTLLGE